MTADTDPREASSKGEPAPSAPASPSIASRYRALIERLDAWFADARREHPGVIPCEGGCTACCHGPFAISVADVALLRRGLSRMPVGAREAIVDRARAQLARCLALEPSWHRPYPVEVLGDERFDALVEALASEPCPLLEPDGRCALYAERPLVCRLMGLPLRSPGGRVLENACPIQDRFPCYRALAPRPFDLEHLEEAEHDLLDDAARALFGDAAFWSFETTIAAALVNVSERSG